MLRERHINQRYVVTRFPREMMSLVEMGLNHREEDTYLPRRVSRTGCNGAIITRRTIVCVG